MRINWRMLAAITLLALFGAACSSDEGSADPTSAEAATAAPEGTEPMPAMTDATPAPGGGESVSGKIDIDGSSTVAPLTSAVYEEYSAEQPDVTVNVGVSGTGGGFERFCTGGTDISNASRPIKDEEAQACADAGIEYTEIRVGTDALTMVVNPENDWVDCLNKEQIQQMWSADRVTGWSEVEGIDQDEEIVIFAPASTSGTYDFFNETVEVEEPTQDYSATENDNDIVRGVEGTLGGWGYFGFAFFQENEGALKALEYDGGEGCVASSVETAQDDSYKLTRPLFIYVKNETLSRPEIENFIRYYLENVNAVIESVGYIPAPDAQIQESMSTFEDALAEAGA